VTDYVILLNTHEAVEAFSGQGQVVLGASLRPPHTSAGSTAAA